MIAKERLLNLRINNMDYDEVKKHFMAFLKSEECRSIMFLNVLGFTLAQKNEAFRFAVSESELLLNDGVGMEKLAVRCGIKFKKNMNGTDLIPELIRWSAEYNDKNTGCSAGIYFLGGKPGVAERAVSEARRKYPGAVITGGEHGYFTKEEEAAVTERINASQARILILGMGMPVQELWINANRNKLKHVRVIIAGGAIIDYISGTVKRAPDIFIKLRLEWLFRMLREPKRLWRRNLIGGYEMVKYYRRLCKRGYNKQTK